MSSRRASTAEGSRGSSRRPSTAEGSGGSSPRANTAGRSGRSSPRANTGRGSGGSSPRKTEPDNELVFRRRGQDQILDEIDRRVIKILQADGRRPNTDIARELHVSETTIRKRIAQLVSRGLINIVAVPTPRALGLTMSAIIGISVTLPKLREISEELKRQQEVRYVGVSTGRYDIIVEAFFFDQQHFLDFISSKLSRMDGITGLETSMILDVVKFSYEWEIA